MQTSKNAKSPEQGDDLELGRYTDSELVELTDEDAEGGTTPTVIIVTVISAASAGISAAL
jgi:hypothetical protein